MKKVLLPLAALLFGVMPNASADNAADTVAAHQLMDRYYSVTRKAKGIEELVPLMAKRNREQVQKRPVPAEMQPMAMQMIRSSVPNSYEISSTKVEPNKVTFALQATQFPKEQLFPIPKDAVATGEFIAVKEGTEWKVYKDYWTAKSADGKEKMSFGTNPDPDKEPILDGKPGDSMTNGKVDVVNVTSGKTTSENSADSENKSVETKSVETKSVEVKSNANATGETKTRD